MPNDLNRIRELSGLQQEAPAKKKLKYSSSQYAQALSQLQLRNHKGELHTITPKQQQKIIDIIEQHGFGVELQNYLHKINVINKYAAVSEAPAAGDQAIKKATESLPAPSSDEEHAEMLFKTHPEYSKKYKTVQNFMRSQDFRDHMDNLSYKAQEASATASLTPNQIEAFKKWYDTYSKMQSKDVYNYAKGIFKAYMETGVTELDGASKQDPKGKAYDDLAKIFPGMDGDIEAIGHQLKSQGVDPLDMEAQEESAAQPVNSSVDDTIQRARAQIETLESALKEDYKKFQGMKPYKPKKK